MGVDYYRSLDCMTHYLKHIISSFFRL